MRLRDNRLWAVVIAMAFLVLWLAGVGVAYAAPQQEPLPDPAPSVQSEGARTVGVAGWCLVAVGFLGVAVCAFLGSRPHRRQRPARTANVSRYPARVMRSVYTPPPSRRYQRNIERRF